jgi:hypothetical protein
MAVTAYEFYEEFAKTKKYIEEQEQILNDNFTTIYNIVTVCNTSKQADKENVDLYLWGIKPHINITFRNLETFKCFKLSRFLENLEATFSDLEIKTTTTDYPDLYERTFTYTLPFCDITVNAFVKTDSEICRRVKTGETIATIPTYKLVCD